MENIKINGHKGTWYVLDSTNIALESNWNFLETLHLLEHETFGEDAPHIIVDEEFNLVMEDVENFQCLTDAIKDKTFKDMREISTNFDWQGEHPIIG